MWHRDAIRPRSDQAAPPTMLFSLRAIYPFISMPILYPPPFRSHDHTISPLSYSSSMPKYFLFLSVLPVFLSSLIQMRLSSASLSVSQLFIFTLPSFLLPSISFFFSHPYSHPTPLFSASLQWQVLWEQGWLCQCQAIPSNDNVYYQLCLPLPMD